MAATILFAVLHALDQFDGDALPPHHRLVLLILADYADDTGKAWPSAASVAKRSGQSRSTVETCLSELETAGWIEGERRHRGARHLSTVYLVRATGTAVARLREGRHARRGNASDTPPRTPCPARHAPHAMRGGNDTPRGGEGDAPRGTNDTPRGGDDPTMDPIIHPTNGPDQGPPAGAREGADVTLGRTDSDGAVSDDGLLRTIDLPPPKLSLLDIAERCAAEGHVYASKMLSKIHAGSTLTTPERAALRRIDDELFGAIPPERRGLHVAFGNAYAVGMREAMGAPFALGRGSRHDLLAMAEHHAKGPNGAELVGDAAIHWFRAVAKEYFLATRADARFQSGFSVAACLRWLNAGRPAARRPMTNQRIQRDTTGAYSEENVRQENLAGMRELAEKELKGFV